MPGAVALERQGDGLFVTDGVGDVPGDAAVQQRPFRVSAAAAQPDDTPPAVHRPHDLVAGHVRQLDGREIGVPRACTSA